MYRLFLDTPGVSLTSHWSADHPSTPKLPNSLPATNKTKLP